ncbi:MAG: HAD family hydrolase [Candidatus Bathyarchaeia archaeon]
MRRGKVKGIIFDLDGTLIRSSIDFPRMKRRMIAILEEHGVPPGLLSPTETTVAILKKAERDEARLEMERAMNQTELEAISTIEGVDGAAETVRRLRERGYRLAVLTRGHQAYAVEALRKTGLLGSFDLVLGRGETPMPKPHAEALRHTAELMGLRLDEVLFVGDHLIDAACAENAGVPFVAVLTGPIKEGAWVEHGQKTILRSVRDLVDYLDEGDC